MQNGTKAAALQSIVQRWLNQYVGRNWRGLVSDHEADVVLAGAMRSVEDTQLDNAKSEARVQWTVDLLT